MSIKIIEPIKNYVNEFKTPAEFNLFYTKNKEEIDNTTTHRLNKLYKIDGYRLTKIKGELCLKRKDAASITRSVTSNAVRNVYDDIESLKDDIDALKSDIITLKTALNEIIKALNANTQ